MGPDNIKGHLAKYLYHSFPHLFSNLFNHCITTGIFPDCWKIAELIIIPKNTIKIDPSAYRPIFLLPSLVKP